MYGTEDVQSQLQRERDFKPENSEYHAEHDSGAGYGGLISYANRRCYEAGYRKNELIGHTLWSGWKVRTKRILRRRCRPRRTGNSGQPELRARRADASLDIFRSVEPMRDEANQVNNVVVVMTDITDAALLQAKLAHAEKMATIGRWCRASRTR